MNEIKRSEKNGRHIKITYVYAVTWDELETVKTSEGTSPFEGSNEFIVCELLVEKGCYSVVKTQLPRETV
ncbi:hypothetical protein BHE89_16375 [Shigella sp. FC1967]|nr:hypothetical protein BHE89_16375 [Shigella sp. FC1967]